MAIDAANGTVRNGFLGGLQQGFLPTRAGDAIERKDGAFRAGAAIAGVGTLAAGVGTAALLGRMLLGGGMPGTSYVLMPFIAVGALGLGVASAGAGLSSAIGD